MISVQPGLSVFGRAKVAVDETRPIGQGGERGEVAVGGMLPTGEDLPRISREFTIFI